MREQIATSIDTAGNIKVEVKGVKGKSCVALTKGLESELGTVLMDVKTGEYNAARQSNNQHIEQR